MATAPPPIPAAQPKQEQDLIPPEEQFWVRYSPQHEFPLSNVISIALHVVVLVLIALLAWQLAPKGVHKVEVEAIRLAGGGGRADGVPEGKPGSGPAPVEAGGTETNPEATPSAEEIQRPDLEKRAPKVADNNPNATRAFDPTALPNSKAFDSLNANLRLKLQAGLAPQGRGGEGSGGGQGKGVGTSTGDGTGTGKGATLSQREKRMVRWTMMFNTNNGPDYLTQLAGLGAILAIPVNEDDSKPDYRLVHDLKAKPAELKQEDLSKMDRIYWIENKPQSVRDIMSALGLSIHPSHFVAFMPKELEDKLQEMEKQAARGKPEDAIKETKFRVKLVGNRFEPELEKITFH
jgi:hypothetical protein